MAVVDTGLAKGPAVTGPTAIAFACFMALTAYNFLELSIIIFATFKKRNGLYFWSFIIANWGTLLHGIGFTLKYFQIVTNGFFYGTISLIGWYAMVTGQSVVLYSRLHLVLKNQTWLRAILVMIIVNAIICHVPITVMYYGANSNIPGLFLSAFSIYEKIQVTIFFLQELIISGLYIQATANFLRNAVIARGNTNHNTIKHLLYVNVVVILLDATILGLEYANMFDFQTSYKGFAYGLKLKIEFSVLNRLIEIATFRAGTYITHSVRDGNPHKQAARDKIQPQHEDHYIHGGVRDEFELQRNTTSANDSTTRITGGKSTSPSERQLNIDAQSLLTQESINAGGIQKQNCD
ncbi:hypothetical protein VFPPC_06909 [Pochonia chlamydosporia 170]|uniref:DUF7703 domain-containing protein n=1 Tax=Pochonia chlamydosporia 170 TaxID=1380566 RepID=A0A179FAI6_METCM|nr:hypothetical protein VFPPC_06909 [Pochonia chlamydosporia 170]OAQ62466.1 hypothetical protein VFPPC_06909 [Pochonia chlamydosporia 170]